MTRLLREQERPQLRAVSRASHDYPDHEKRMLDHIARIDALGLSGEAWDRTARENANMIRGLRREVSASAAAAAAKKLRPRPTADDYRRAATMKRAKERAERRQRDLEALRATQARVRLIREDADDRIRRDLEAICARRGVDMATLMTRRRWREVVRVRRYVIGELWNMGHTHAAIGALFGHDHTWSIYLVKTLFAQTAKTTLDLSPCEPA